MSLEKKRKHLEIKKCDVAAEDMELKILDRLEEVERLKENVNNQRKHIEKLQNELKEME